MSWLTRKSFINSLFILALSILCLVAILSSLQLKRLHISNERVTHTYQVIETADGILMHLIDAESKQRGYLLTNDNAYLNNFHDSLNKVHQKFLKTQQLTVDNPTQQWRLANLSSLLKTRIQLLEKIADINSKQGIQAAMKIFAINQGKILTEQIWQKLAEIIVEEEKLLQQRIQAVEHESQVSTFLINISHGICLILLLFSIILINQQLNIRMRSEKNLNELQNRLTGIIESTSDCIAALDLNLCLLAFNNAYAQTLQKIFGIQVANGTSLIDAFANFPKDQAQVIDVLQNALSNEHFTTINYLRGVDGTQYIYEIQFNSLLNNKQERIGITFVMRDITARVNAEQQLQESEERFRKAFDYSGVGIALVSLDGKWLKLNKAFCEIIGHDEVQLTNKNLQALTFPADVALTMLYLQQLQTGTISFCQIENRYIQNNGNIIWAYTTISLMRDTHENPAYYIVQIQDINSKKQAEEQLKHIAYHDPLTGLANRAHLEHATGTALAAAQHQQTSIAILFLDLDGFKIINDNYGHDVGDNLLKQVAERLKTCILPTDIIARLGGDEFIIVLTSLNKPKIANVIADKVLYQLQQSFEVLQHTIRISTSVGISLYPEHGDTYTGLMKNADLALYAAKSKGRNNYQFFNDNVNNGRH